MCQLWGWLRSYRWVALLATVVFVLWARGAATRANSVRIRVGMSQAELGGHLCRPEYESVELALVAPVLAQQNLPATPGVPPTAKGEPSQPLPIDLDLAKTYFGEARRLAESDG